MNDDKLEMRPGGLDTLSTGMNLAELDLHGGEGLWDEVVRFTRESQIEHVVDSAMGGRSAPRIWAFLESPGAGPSAATAALGAARVLADRGQAVVLVDVDEQEPRITRWLGRNEVEGWIDMVRFGASLHAASDALPSDNRRGSVLGVGSFAPTGVTPEEVADLLARLRRQADDLVLVLPAKLRSLPWLETAHIRLLCWDLLSRGAGDTEQIITELDRMGAKPDALVGFGVEEFSAIQNRLREETASPAPTPGPEPVAPPVAMPAELADEPAAMPEAADEPAAVAEVTDEPAAAAETVEEPLPATDTAAEPSTVGAPGKRRSSGIFIFTAVVAVACLGLLGYFLAGQMGESEGQQPPQLAQLQPETTAPAETAPVVDADEDTGEPALSGDAAMPVEEVGAEEPSLATPPVAAPATDPAIDSDAGPAVEPELEPEVVDLAPTVPENAAAAAAPELDWEAYRKPVGTDGWALWLYSFPDAQGADVEIRQLERRGFNAVVKEVEIPDRGRWYRVYVGSFADRNAARAAVAGVQARLKQDWVVPAKF